MSDQAFDDISSLQARYEALKAEHRDLDEAIARLSAAPPDDQLLVLRLKKRKLALKDRLVAIERLLEPDELA